MLQRPIICQKKANLISHVMTALTDNEKHIGQKKKKIIIIASAVTEKKMN